MTHNLRVLWKRENERKRRKKNKESKWENSKKETKKKKLSCLPAGDVAALEKNELKKKHL